jgi:hypothetical protein
LHFLFVYSFKFTLSTWEFHGPKADYNSFRIADPGGDDPVTTTTEIHSAYNRSNPTNHDRTTSYGKASIEHGGAETRTGSSCGR